MTEFITTFILCLFAFVGIAYVMGALGNRRDYRADVRRRMGEN